MHKKAPNDLEGPEHQEHFVSQDLPIHFEFLVFNEYTFLFTF